MKRRLRFEFLTLELIEKRRRAESKPDIGRLVEQRIVERHLRELEELTAAQSAALSEN